MSYTRLTNTLSNTESKDSLNKLSDTSKLALLETAEKYFNNRQYDLALNYYNSYLQHHPYNLNILFNKGTTLAALGKFEEAVDIFKYILSIESNDPEVLNNYGAVLLHLNQPELALTQFTNALKFRPGHEDTLHNQGAAYYAMGNSGSAVVSFERALAINSTNEKIIQSHKIASRAFAAAKRESDTPIAMTIFKQPQLVVNAPKKEASPSSSSTQARLG